MSETKKVQLTCPNENKLTEHTETSMMGVDSYGSHIVLMTVLCDSCGLQVEAMGIKEAGSDERRAFTFEYFPAQVEAL